jgi:GcrA cell cycle regulator
MSAHWTEDRIEQVKTMWGDGFSASQIARALGGVSRNAVIGIIHRRGLSSGRAQRTTSNKQAFAVQKRFIAPVEEAPSLPVTAPDPVPGITIENVTHKQCRWPYGDPAKPDFHLCGHPTITLSPYCAHHARKAFAPGYVRARKDEAAEELNVIFRAERMFA